MKQIAAIFSKDVRHLRPEISLSLALLVVLDLVYPDTWRHSGPSAGASFSPLALVDIGPLPDCLAVLVPVGWWILTARLIHTERFVGDTQFWLTRPYGWTRLLAAKLLFLICFICMPFLLSQAVLLGEAGFNPLPSTFGMLDNLFAVTCMLVLPLVALSTITSSFGKLVLVLLGIFLFFVGEMAFTPSHSAGIPGPGGLGFPIFVGGCVAAIVVQFALRNRRLASLLLVGVPVLLCLLGSLPLDRGEMDRRFPENNGKFPVRFAYSPDDVRKPGAGETDKGAVEVSVPMKVSGVPDGYVAIGAGTKAAIEAPNGERWESPWKGSGSGEKYPPGITDSTRLFAMPHALYDRLKGKPVRLRFAIAFELAREISSTTVALPQSEFNVAGVGICTTEFGTDGTISGAHCRSAMRHPALTYVTARWTESECTEQRQSEAETWLGESWIGSTDPRSWDFGLVSVWLTPLSLSNRFGLYTGKPPEVRHMCVGSPITFSRYEPVGQSRTELVVENFQLPPLSKRGYGGSLGMPLR